MSCIADLVSYMHQITQDSPVQTRAGACNGESFRREIHTMGEEVCLEQGKLQQTQTDSVDKMLTGFDCHAGITRVERGLRFNQGVAGLNGSTGLGCDQNLQVLLATKPETQTVCSRAARLPMSMPARWCSAQCGSRQGPLGSVPQNVSRALKERSFTPSFGPCCLGKAILRNPGPKACVEETLSGFAATQCRNVVFPCAQPPTRAVGPAPSRQCQEGAVQRRCLPQDAARNENANHD